MEDRELLELAAKAAGMHPGTYQDGWHYSSAGPYGEGVYKIDPLQPLKGNPRPLFKFWNPLTNDGDALRLAVKLKMGIDTDAFMHWGPVVSVTSSWHKSKGYSGSHPENHGKDPLCATRRAIVNAAAEIGKAMP